MVILNPRGPAGGRHLVGGPSELGPLYLVFHAQAVWPTRMTSTSMSISSLPFIYNTCIHDPNIHDTWHMYWWWMFILYIHNVLSLMYLWSWYSGFCSTYSWPSISLLTIIRSFPQECFVLSLLGVHHKGRKLMQSKAKLKGKEINVPLTLCSILNPLFFRCASISCFQVVSKWVSDSYFFRFSIITIITAISVISVCSVSSV